MVNVTTVSGAFGLADTDGIRNFCDQSLLGAAGDVMATYQDAGNRGVWVICSSA